MKKMLTTMMMMAMTTVSALAGVTALAAPEHLMRVLKDTTTQVALELTPTTVFCTARGYMSEVLKVSVPDLDWLAHFDHRVEAEGLPCVAGGPCIDGFGPGQIIDPNDRVALASVRVVLEEHLTLDRQKRTCSRVLGEKIHAVIRGRDFDHFKDSGSESVDFEKCEKLIRQ
jgi:hypothetical protein